MSIALPAQFADPDIRTSRKFRMVSITPDCAFPRGPCAFQKLKKLLAANLGPGCLYQKGTASARAHERIDFPQQIIGQEDMGSFRRHDFGEMCILSVL
jgi:hypothetical protein